MAKISFKQKGVSLYYHVEKYIRQKIESGEWPLGEKLPTEAELADFFNVSRTTIRQSVNGMVEAGLLVRRQGSGTYVAQSPYARSRLSAQPSNAVCKHVYTPILQDDMTYCYHNLLRMNISHTLMLTRQKMISREDAQTLVRFILPLFDKYPQTIGSNPLNEDYYLNFEQFLISNLGMDLGGEIHMARSRNDMVPTVLRMSVRDNLLIIYERLLMLIRRLLILAEENQNRVITGYTHWQPSQPTTLGHYFLAIASALQRDFERLLSAYKTLNRSPLGACALAGTSFPIDRDYTARLLGFDEVMENTLDAVASRDYLLEISADLATMGSTISRFVQDMYLWSTAEFGYVQFSDATSCCSSTMPQKRNPLSAEHIKSKTAHLASGYIDVLMVLKGTVYSHCRDLFECMPPFWNNLEESRKILELLIDMLQDISFRYDRMEQVANSNNSVLTDLADYITRKCAIPFRIAHNIVADAIKQRDGECCSQIELTFLNNAAKQVIGKELDITQNELSSVLLASTSVEGKVSVGSPSQMSCQKMLLHLRKEIDSNEQQLNQLQNSLSLTEQFREEQIKYLLNESPK